MFKAMAAGALALGTMVGAAEAAPVPAYNWTGLYIGAFGGGVGGMVPDLSGGGPSGVDAGLTLGYAWQAHGVWVFEPFLAVPLARQTGRYYDFDVRIDWAALAGLKLGVANGRWLPYAFLAGLVGGASVTSSGVTESQTHAGLAFGVGADYALTDQWSIGARFAHVAADAKHYFGSDFSWSGNSIAATINFKLK